MANIVLGNFTFQLSDVQKINATRNANLDKNSMPLSDADSALIFDFDGVMKTLALTGILTDATTTRVAGQSVLTITQQKNYLEGLADGFQSALSFSSTYESGYYVWIDAMTFDEEAGNVNSLPFTLNLTVGSQ